MDATRSSVAPPPVINAVRQYVSYGARTTTAQHHLDGRLLVDNFPEGLVRPL